MNNTLNPKKRARKLAEKRLYERRKVSLTQEQFALIITFAVIGKKVIEKKPLDLKKGNAIVKLPSEEKEEELPLIAMTEMERDEIIKQTLLARSLVVMLPPITSYNRIQVALKISALNPKELCVWAIDKITRGMALAEFSSASPTWSALQGTYASLFPLASIGKGYLSPSDKTTRDELARKLKGMFQDNANDCAKIAVGNVPLFQLIGYGIKGSSERHHGSLPACDAKTNNQKGAGKMGVSCKVIAKATRYIVYYGITPVYNASTWSFTIGSSRQIIGGLTSGTAYYFIMVAIGSDGEGKWMTPIVRNAPFA